VWVVGHLFKASDPDAVRCGVANMTLGGLFTSRLMTNLRETHGYSYGVYSRLSLMRNGGTFSASGGSSPKIPSTRWASTRRSWTSSPAAR